MRKEKQARYMEKYTQAESAFLRMMRTPKNDGSERWRKILSMKLDSNH